MTWPRLVGVTVQRLLSGYTGLRFPVRGDVRKQRLNCFIFYFKNGTGRDGSGADSEARVITPLAVLSPPVALR